MPHSKKFKKPSGSWRSADQMKLYADEPKEKPEEEDFEDSDPENEAEREYARLHGEEASSVQKVVPAASVLDACEGKAKAAVKANQAKAARKARGRGVSGSMSKKEKQIGHGGYDCEYYATSYGDYSDEEFEDEAELWSEECSAGNGNACNMAGQKNVGNGDYAEEADENVGAEHSEIFAERTSVQLRSQKLQPDANLCNRKT